MVSDEVVRQLARDMTLALASVGVPAFGDPEGGVSVLTHTSEDVQELGVQVDWRVGQVLQEEINDDLLAGRFSSPAIRLSGAVGDAMSQALDCVLTALGFTVEAMGDDSRGSLRVTGRRAEVSS